MVEWLAQSGVECTVLTTYPYYPHWAVQEPYRKNRFFYKIETKAFPSGGKIKVIRCPIYVPKNPSGLKRMILDVSFLVSSFVPLLFLLFSKKRNNVMAIAPSFLLGLPALIYKKVKGAKMIYHIQDLQIEAAKELGMIKSQRLLNTLFMLEAVILKKADVVSSISDGMMSRIKSKAKKEIYFLPNWSNVEMFQPDTVTDVEKAGFGFDPNDRIILYSGAIGQKQGLEVIIDAAKHFRDQAELKFVICGSGPYKTHLQQWVQKEHLSNIVFLPLQPIEKFNAFLNIAEVHLVIQKADASDLMLPSKLTTILSVGGLALITANQGSGLYQLVDNHGVGRVVKAENLNALINGITESLNPQLENDDIRSKARKYAEQHLDINAILNRFQSELT
jgi:colanic acid biosynthesis glycosyl transferase WcaI